MAKTKTKRVQLSEPGEIKTVFSRGTKTVLKQLLCDAISLIDSGKLHDSAGLGTLAGHIGALADFIDCSDEFTLGLHGDIKDVDLIESFQSAYGPVWQQVLGSNHKLWDWPIV